MDIQQVLNRSSSEVSLDDLTRRGFKQVRVLNHSTVTRLISEAVDHAMAERESTSGSMDEEERRRVIEESHKKFQELARGIKREHERVATLEAENRGLREELEILQNRVAAYMQVQAERDQALQTLESLRQQTAAGCGSCQTLKEQVTGLRATVRELESERDSLQNQLAGGSYAGGSAGGQSLLERLSEQLAALKQQPSSDVQQIKDSLALLTDRLSKMALTGGKAGSVSFQELDNDTLLNFAEKIHDEVDVEANAVEVKQATSRGVKGSLDKLKKMQKGV